MTDSILRKLSNNSDGLTTSEHQPLLPSANNIQDVPGRSIERGHSSLFGAIFIVINAAMGAGLLTFPYTYALTGGWYAGVTVQMVLLPIIILGLVILAYCAELKQCSAYEDIMAEVLAPWMRHVTEACVILYMFGSCTTFLIIIGDQVEDLTSAFHYHSRSLSHFWWANRKFELSLATLLLVYPWLYLKKIGWLSYTSFLGVGACVYLSIVVMIRYFTLSDDCHDYHVKKNSSPPFVLAYLLNSIPFLCFAFQCHVSSVPIYASLKHRTLKNYLVVILIGLGLCSVVYSIAGVFGVLTFDTNYINSDILRNYKSQDALVIIARIMIILCLITSYPILYFCAKLSLDGALKRLMIYLSKKFQCFQKVFCSEEVCTEVKCRKCRISKLARLLLIANIWALSTLSLSLFVPQIHYVIKPLGCLAAAFIFIFPGLCLLQLSINKHFRKLSYNVFTGGLSFFIIVMGAFIMGDNFVSSIIDDINHVN